MTCEPWLIGLWLGLSLGGLTLLAVLYVLTVRERRHIDRIRDEALSDLQAMLDRHAERTPR